MTCLAGGENIHGENLGRFKVSTLDPAPKSLHPIKAGPWLLTHGQAGRRLVKTTASTFEKIPKGRREKIFTKKQTAVV